MIGDSTATIQSIMNANLSIAISKSA